MASWKIHLSMEVSSWENDLKRLDVPAGNIAWGLHGFHEMKIHN
jgi:hypothetical protein